MANIFTRFFQYRGEGVREMRAADRPPSSGTSGRPPSSDPTGRREWKEVAPEELPELFRTHRPLCWSCHNIAAFEREFPGMAFERPGARPIIARND